MQRKKVIDKDSFNIITQRLCFQLIENHNNLSDSTVLIGIQNNGALYLKFLIHHLSTLFQNNHPFLFGFIDITFFRDDVRTNKEILRANKTEISFSLDNKRVILIDDVLYTGRSVRSAMDALNSFGRPKSIHLLSLVNRRFSREIPIQPDYLGLSVDTVKDEHVVVELNEKDWTGEIFIEKKLH